MIEKTVYTEILDIIGDAGLLEENEPQNSGTQVG